MWTSFPIEKQAYDTYTRDLYEKFHTEFKLIGRYNVRPHGSHMYEIYPNETQTWVAKYGSRSYFVTSDPSAGDYTCEYCKMDRDCMLCCHILTQLGINKIPAKYLL